ncbi:MAG: hypothetical protein C7B45_00825 [Sulfobacillus acidophilus]|uniref:Uncharacterized protein n=1 Tax=Sulfobacillus acidophilus TaxID=53633 RepID=A0A2T2WPL6_9FIRM|nr:MAG: hypothetical protein C7B45_00825 [Sulfobacillus acidophilus]
MKIKDFHITGQYPALFVETEVEESKHSSTSPHDSGSIRLNLGPWNYVSLLNEGELKSLIHLVYQSQLHHPTRAMQELIGASLDDATDTELP